MAGARKPGSQCAYSDPADVHDGTLCRAESPTPGTLTSELHASFVSISVSLDSGFEIVEASFQETYQGVARGMQPYYEGALCIYNATTRAEELVPEAVLKETGYELGALLSGLIPGLLQMLAVLAATTFLGAGVGALIGFFAGGGVGAAPGAVIGADMGFDLGMAVLTWLGLAFLAVSIAKGFGEMVTALRNGVEWAWQARTLKEGAREKQVDRAAHELARTVAILVRLILQAIVAYLLKKAAVSSTRGLIGTTKGIQSAGSAAVSDEIVAELVGKLRASKLGGGFADWVEKNWRDIVKNPRLREAEGGTLAKTGGTATAQESSQSAVSKKPPAKPSPKAKEPAAAWQLGKFKSAQRWANQMAKRGWTSEQISRAMEEGQQFPAVNEINPANTATRYVDPITGRSVVVDDVTHEVLHVGGDGFKY
jgi:hypothetical protein